jgi:hypothetical protein
METLYTLAEKHGADKAALGYIKHYESRFESIRLDAVKILEIGVETGKSHRMWLEYFPNATIYGFDIFNELDRSNYVAEFYRLQQTCRHLDRSVIFKGSQESEEDLKQFINLYGGDFDIIIDDGGHTMRQQQVSLKYLFDQVKPGGYYVVEDLHACSGQWKTLYGYEVIEPGDTLTTDLLNSFSNKDNVILETNYLLKEDIERITNKIESCVTEIGVERYRNFIWPSLLSFIKKSK